MDARRRQELLGQWGVREAHPHELEEGVKAADDLAGSPVAGRPLPVRPRLFKLEADSYIASLGGPLPYMARLREIDALTSEHERRLVGAYEACGGDEGAWRELVLAWDFGEVNELIDRHNRWYPVERRLPMDPKTGDFALVNGRSYRRPPLDAAWALARTTSRAA
jgi:hypothetical protein